MPSQYPTFDRDDTRATVEFDTAVKRKIDRAGRVLLPAKYRKALAVEAGSDVMLVLNRSVLEVHTIENAVRDAQALVRQHVPRDRSLVKELIEERKQEAVGE